MSQINTICSLSLLLLGGIPISGCVSLAKLNSERGACVNELSEYRRDSGISLSCFADYGSSYELMRATFFRQVAKRCGENFTIREYSEGYVVISEGGGEHQSITGIFECRER